MHKLRAYINYYYRFLIRKIKMSEILTTEHVEMNNLFWVGDQVFHIRSGYEYVILAEPNPTDLLEYCREPFYTYEAVIHKTASHVTWHRAKSEMEDGRFTLIIRKNLNSLKLNNT